MEPLFNIAGAPFRRRVDPLKDVLLHEESGLEELTGEFLEFTQSLLFEQGGVFKYGFTATGQGLAFHCALFTRHPDLAELASELFPEAEIEQDILFFPGAGAPSPEPFRRLIQSACLLPFPPGGE